MWGEGSGGSKHRTRIWIPGGSTRKLLAGKQCWLVGGGEGEEDENASESADQLGREGLGGRGLDANTSQTRPLSMCPSKTREAGRTKMIPLPVPNWASAEAQFIPNFSLHTKFFRSRQLLLSTSIYIFISICICISTSAASQPFVQWKIWLQRGRH